MLPTISNPKGQNCSVLHQKEIADFIPHLPKAVSDSPLQMFNIGCSRFIAIKRTYIPQLHVSTRHHPTAQRSSSDPKFDLSNSTFPLRISKMWSVDIAGVKALVRMQYGDDPAGMSFGLLPFSEIPSLSSLGYCLLGSVSSYSFFTSLAPR